MSKRFTFGSLFSGIGGIDLGLCWAGFTCEWQVEIDNYAQKVLQKHWPNVTRYGDIRTVDTSTLTRVDLITGGMPCQPHSLAGLRKASADERNLWPEFHRIIRELRPKWVLCENVVGLLSSEDGRFFGGILRDLAQARYDAEWFVLSAAQFGAPHLRERVFIVAHSTSPRWEEQSGASWLHDGLDASSVLSDSNRFQQWLQQEQESQCEGQAIFGDDGTQEPLADPQRMLSLQHDGPSMQQRWQKAAQQTGMGSSHVAHPSGSGWQECEPTPITEGSGHTPWCTSAKASSGQFEPCVGRDASRVSNWMDRYRWPAFPRQPQQDWEPPRVTQEKVPHRSARLKALGNSVLPQIAEYIGRAILESEARHA